MSMLHIVYIMLLCTLVFPTSFYSTCVVTVCIQSSSHFTQEDQTDKTHTRHYRKQHHTNVNANVNSNVSANAKVNVNANTLTSTLVLRLMLTLTSQLTLM